MFTNFFEEHGDYFYFVFRVIVGLMFFVHGAQKLFGWFGGQSSELVSLIGLAGLIEFVGGILIVLGLFTRIAACINGLLMLVAYFMAHASKAVLPINNGGELAVLYFLAFLVMLAYGPKKWSLDQKIWKRS